MKKQGRQFIILIAVLAVLAAGYFCLRQYNTHQQEKEAEQEDGIVLVDIDQEDILRFSYVYEDVTYSFERSGEEGEWVYTDDPSLNLTQSRLDNMAGKLASITAEDMITDVTDMSQYGLEEPANILHWETAENSYTYYVGEYNSFGTVYYFCEQDSDAVYTVYSSLVYGFNYSLEDLIEEEEAEESGEAESEDAAESQSEETAESESEVVEEAGSDASGESGSEETGAAESEETGETESEETEKSETEVTGEPDPKESEEVESGTTETAEIQTE